MQVHGVCQALAVCSPYVMSAYKCSWGEAISLAFTTIRAHGAGQVIWHFTKRRDKEKAA